jgi:DNA topoisomerase-2
MSKKSKKDENDKNIAKEYHLTTARDHMLFKEMWGGSANLIEILTFIMDKWKVSLEKTNISDRFIKCFDELITNAADQCSKTAKLKKPHKMDSLWVEFDIETGKIIVANNGDGFDVIIHPEDEKKRYVPEIITTEALRGSNFTKEKDNTRAGTNGVGSKLANAHSLEFTLETYDIKRKKHFKQTSRNHIDIIEPPIITDGDETTEPLTKIEFQLDYAAVGYGSLDPYDPNDKDKTKSKDKFRKINITKNDFIQLEKVIRMRVAQMSVFLGESCTVYYNKEEVPFKTLESLAAAIYEGKTIYVGSANLYDCPAKSISDADKNNEKEIEKIKTFNKSRKLLSKWQIIVAIDVQNTEQLSFVNGVVCTEGNHLEKIKDEIHSAAKEKAKDLIESSSVKYHGQLMSGIAIMMSGMIPNVQWGGGQLKTAIKMDKKEFIGLEIDKKIIKDVCEVLYDRMLISKGQSKKTNNVKIKSDKYEKAAKLGSDSFLILSEGDSADSTVQIGRRDKKCDISGPNFGTFILGGVPMNSRKEVEIREIAGHEPIKIMSKRLTNNETFQQLEAVLNLDKNKKYDTQKERSTLNYGGIIMIADEDLDGYSILTLTMNHFDVFWPELIKCGFIKRLRTPLIRLYPKLKNSKSKVLEFFNENKAKSFLAADNNKEKYTVSYYKGLSAHEHHEIIHMFTNIRNNLITFNYDDKARETFELYYSDNVAPRKIEFSTPVEELTDAESNKLEKEKIIDCSIQIKKFTKDYKLDNLTRKLPSIADGFVITRRRILFGAIYKFGYSGSNDVMKIFQFGGSVAENANYHHGDGSLNTCITNMARSILTMEQLPVLQNKGNTGSEFKGGADAGSPRYVGVRLNRNLVAVLYPKADLTVLDYIWEDNKRSIPKYYAPIAPTIIFRAEKIPADGWNYITWARDIPATLDVLRNMIKDTLDKRRKIKIPASSAGYKGILTAEKDDEYTLGTYEATEKEIIITNLPLRVWAHPYMRIFLKKEEYKDSNRPNVIKKRVIANEYSDEYKAYFDGDGPINECTNDSIRIKFKLKPGALDKIKKSKNLMDVENIIDKGEPIIKYAGSDDSNNNNNTNDEGEEYDDSEAPEIKQYTNKDKIGDEIQKFFGLVVRMRHNLNILSSKGAVSEYKNYEDILKDWFPIRKEIYERRIKREHTLIEIEIKYLKELLRFLSTYKEIGMSENLEENKIIELLEKNKFHKINSRVYNNPGYADENPTEQLNKLIFETDNDYTYLFNTRIIDRSVNNQNKIKSKISELEARLNIINVEIKKDKFVGASQWLREIDEFEKVYNVGIATKWTYGENDHVQFEAK